MYIEPNTTIVLYHNIPLDNTYDHTIDFETRQAQTNYFHPTGQNNIVKRVFNEQTYQRVVKGKMRVEATAEFLYDCNYMSFKNTAFGNKWFYAFVTGVEYVNNVTSEITYEIDPLQTYMFDVTLKECFVEREHTQYDNVGDNIVPEDLRIDEYIQDPPKPSGLFNADEWGIMVQSPYNYDGDNEDVGRNYNGVGSGNIILVFPYSQSVSGTEYRSFDFLQNYLNHRLSSEIEGISLISMFPTRFCNWVELVSGKDRFKITGEKMIDYFTVTRPSLNGNYAPKNKKLLTYPYMYLGMNCGNGNSAVYRYEYFPIDIYKFAVEVDANTVTAICAPMGYQGNQNLPVAQRNTINWNYSITMGDIPMCSWAIDSYTVWMAQNKVSFASSAIMGGASSVVQAASGNVVGGALNLASTIASSIGKYEQVKAMPDYVKGNAGSGLGIANGTQDFNWYNVHLNSQNARIIDNYFSMFGYAIKRVKKPQYRFRPHWNYIKTNGCVLIGNAPSEDVRKICSIFDNGITFWKNASEVGNYDLDNSPTSVLD